MVWHGSVGVLAVAVDGRGCVTLLLAFVVAGAVRMCEETGVVAFVAVVVAGVVVVAVVVFVAVVVVVVVVFVVVVLVLVVVVVVAVIVVVDVVVVVVVVVVGVGVVVVQHDGSLLQRKALHKARVRT